MGENAELQEEELQVLKSIYEGDDLYTNPDKQTHLYKFGEVGTLKTFILGMYGKCNTDTDIHCAYFSFRNQMDRRVSFWTASSEFRVILQQAPGTWGQN